MKRLILPIVGLLLGLAGGTAWTVTTRPPADAVLATDSVPADVVATDSGRADAMATDSGRADAMAADSPPPDTVRPEAGAAASVAPVDPNLAAAAGTDTVPARGPAAKEGEVGAQEPMASAPHDSAGDEGVSESRPAAADSRGVKPASPDAAGLASAASSAPAHVHSEAGAIQLAKIFSAMQPGDAARVLAEMADDEIERILAHVAARQAAAILSSLEPARAATLSRGVLGQAGAP